MRVTIRTAGRQALTEGRIASLGGSGIYRIEFSPAGLDQLHALSARQRAVVLDEIERQLTHQPAKETRNRKHMRENPLAPWELRIGDLRVYYDWRDEPEPTVLIRAIGVKVHNELLIGGKVVRP